jgi:HEAT repeat protein
MVLHATSNPEDQLQRLMSPDRQTRQSAHYDILAERKRTIEHLIGILESRPDDRSFGSSFHFAVVLLGELRATEALMQLNNLLLYVPDEFEAHRSIPPELRHVAAVALRDIGEPAVGGMLGRISATHDENEGRMAAWVILQIEGKEQALRRISMEADRTPWVREKFETAAKFVADSRAIASDKP